MARRIRRFEPAAARPSLIIHAAVHLTAGCVYTVPKLPVSLCHRGGDAAVRPQRDLRCRMTRVDAARRLVCRRCQRCSCSRSHKLPEYEKKTKQRRSENILGVSHVREGENRQTQCKDFVLFFCPNSSRFPRSPLCFSPRRLLPPGSPAGGVARQPAGRPALAPPVAHTERLSDQLHGGQTRRGGSCPRRVQHPAGGSGCTALTFGSG